MFGSLPTAPPGILDVVMRKSKGNVNLQVNARTHERGLYCNKCFERLVTDTAFIMAGSEIAVSEEACKIILDFCIVHAHVPAQEMSYGTQALEIVEADLESSRDRKFKDIDER